jgi:hypothetical protein
LDETSIDVRGAQAVLRLQDGLLESAKVVPILTAPGGLDNENLAVYIL